MNNSKFHQNKRQIRSNEGHQNKKQFVDDSLITHRLKTVIQEQNIILKQLSSELRTHLSSVLALGQEIKEDHSIKLSASIPPLLKNTITQTRSLINSLNISQDLIRLNELGLPLQVNKLNMTNYIFTAIGSISTQSVEKGIEVKYNPIESDLYVYLDKTKIKTCLTGIIEFVLSYTARDSVINIDIVRDIHSEMNHRILRINIYGTKFRVPSKIISQVFASRHYLKSSQAQIGNNLTVPKYYARLHGGDLKIKGVPDQGNVITLELPVGLEHLTKDEIDSGYLKTPPIAELKPPETPKMEIFPQRLVKSALKPTILVVDDDDATIVLVSVILRKNNNILIANSGEAALKLLTKHKPDLIITDIMMPGMDGIDFTKKVKNNPALMAIPIILLTAAVTDQTRLDGLKSKADAYLTKPFDAAELHIIIKNLIEKYHQLAYHYAVDLSSHFPDRIKLKGQDKDFLERIHESVKSNLNNPNYSTDHLARSVFLSKRQLERKLKKLTHFSPGKFILEMKLATAYELLKNNATDSVSQTALAVGFKDAAYFSKLFIQKFQVTPSALINRISVTEITQ